MLTCVFVIILFIILFAIYNIFEGLYQIFAAAQDHLSDNYVVH